MTTRYAFVLGTLLILLIALTGIGGTASTAMPLAPAGICPEVTNSLYFTIVYGAVTVNGAAAPVGAVVEARSPRSDVVGCAVVAQAGSYGMLYVYGADDSVSPPVPGMLDGEAVAFYVDGQPASAAPPLVWHNDHQIHAVDLDAGEVTVTPTVSTTVTVTPPAACPEVVNTLKLTIVYGSVALNGSAAPVDTIVEAHSPRGEVAGCYKVTQAGNYGTLYIYGADDSVSPPLPGMQTGETVAFYVNGQLATSSPILAWANDRDFHEVALNVEAGAPTLTPTPDPGVGKVFLPLVMR